MSVSTMKSFALTAGLAALGLIGCQQPDASSTTPGQATADKPSTAASTAPAAGSKLKIAFVTNNASDYWTIVKKGTEAAAKELGDVDVDFIMPPNGKAPEQKQLVEDAITKGDKAVAISPIDPANQTDWLNEVAGKVSLITQDSDAANSKRICYLGTDNHAAGLLAGKLIKEALPQGGKIMLFVGDKGAQNAKDRAQGIVDALQGSNVTIVDTRTDEAKHDKAKTNAADVLVSNPDVVMEVGLWSYNGPAIYSAVKDAGKAGKVKVVCFDSEDETMQGIKDGTIYATVVQQPYKFGYEGVKLLEKILKGDKSTVPANGLQYFDPIALKADNVDQYKADQDKLRAQ